METRHTEVIRLIALGGVGETGKNMYVVEIDADIFIVDAGLKYPENELLGIDIVIPDIPYLLENKDRIKGIFLTNGTEEQIGAISYLLRKIETPVFGTKLTLSLVEEKLKQSSIEDTSLFHEIDPNKSILIGNTEISFFRTHHSIPDSIGICFHTSQGAIVHTGDFTFDQTPAGSYKTEIGKIANFGNKGVLCLLSDSTNAEFPGFSPSDEVIGGAISKVITNTIGRVFVVVHETNIYQIQQIFDTAKKSDRKIAIVGKSLPASLKNACKLNFLHSYEDLLIPIEDIRQFSNEQLILLSTSNQGDPFKEISLMAKHAHKQVSIQEGDTIFIAFSPQPSFEVPISKTVDLLFRSGANVVFGQKKRFHASGHGNQDELKLMLNLIQPAYFIPVRGEYRMQIAHAKLAQSVGVSKDNIFLVEKGDVIEFKNGQAKISGKVDAGQVLIDGLGIGDVGNIVLRDRRLLSQDGILIVVVTLNKVSKQIAAGPEIISRGFVYVRESEKLIDEAIEIVKTIVEKNIEGNNIEWSTIKLNIRESLNLFLFEKTKRRPMILPIIMEI